MDSNNKLFVNTFCKKSRDLKEFENQSTISLIVDKKSSKLKKNITFKTKNENSNAKMSSTKHPEVRIDNSSSLLMLNNNKQNKSNNSNVNKISKSSINSSFNQSDEQKNINKGINR